MSLYLCVFRDDEEIQGVEVGSYDDFSRFRDGVAQKLENGKRASRFPVLQLHPDSEGEWGIVDCRRLEQELAVIQSESSKLPPVPLAPDQQGVAREVGIVPRNLAESFIDVDGESLLSRLSELCRSAIEHNQPILFQ